MRWRLLVVAVAVVVTVAACGDEVPTSDSQGSAPVAPESVVETSVVDTTVEASTFDSEPTTLERAPEGRSLVRLEPPEPIPDAQLEAIAELTRDRLRQMGLVGTVVVRDGGLDVTLPGMLDAELVDASRGPSFSIRPVLAAEPVGGLDVTPEDEITSDSEVVLVGRDGEYVYRLGPQGVSGTGIADAQVQIDQFTGEGWEIVVRLVDGPEGLGAWNDLASACYNGFDECAGRGMAIVLGSEVISAPVPQQPHFDSPEIVITNAGGFEETDAREIARTLKYASALPEMRVVSITPLD